MMARDGFGKDWGPTRDDTEGSGHICGSYREIVVVIILKLSVVRATDWSIRHIETKMAGTHFYTFRTFYSAS